MSVAGKSPVRPLVVGGIAGLILGCIIGLIIGWVVWPVQYVGEAYTYELNEAEKMEYVAAVVDSYNLTGQTQVAQQRFNGWTIEEKVDALAQLFAEYEAEVQHRRLCRNAQGSAYGRSVHQELLGNGASLISRSPLLN